MPTKRQGSRYSRCRHDVAACGPHNHQETALTGHLKIVRRNRPRSNGLHRVPTTHRETDALERARGRWVTFAMPEGDGRFKRHGRQAPGPVPSKARSGQGYSWDMRARIVTPGELTSSDIARWSECAACSVEPNPFFEPDWLLPALEYLDEVPATALVLAEHGGTVRACVPVTSVTAHQGRTGGPGHTALKTRVVPTAVSLGTPLVSPDGGRDALACVLNEIRREAEQRGAHLVIMEWVGHDGPISGMLTEAGAETNNRLVEFDLWERGLLRRRDDEEEDYWLRGIGKNRRRSIRQHHQHLIEALGASPTLRKRSDGACVDAFLQLEASGWKGHEPEGAAMWRQVTTTRFFEAVCSRYLADGRMWFASLEVNETPIAMVCCVRAGRRRVCLSDRLRRGPRQVRPWCPGVPGRDGTLRPRN